MKQLITFLLVAVMATFLNSEAFAQIAQRGGAQSANSTNTTLTITKPTGVVAGDVLIANIVQRNSTGAISLAGWTSISQGNIDGGTTRAAVLYKVAGGSEPANYAFALGTGANNNTGTIVAFSGVDVTGGFLVGGGAGGPFDVAPGTLSLSGSAQNSGTATAITTATPNAAVIMFAQTDNNETMGSWSTTSPGTLTELYENQYNGSGATDLTTGAAWAAKATTGSTGSGTVSFGASVRWGAMLIALKPISVNAGPDQLVNGTSVSLVGSTNAGSPTYAWTRTSGPNTPTITSASSAATTVTGLIAGTYVFRLTVNGTPFDEVTVRVITGSNLWATSVDGTQIASFSTNGAAAISGPATMFAPSYTGATNTYTRTAALGRTDKPSQTAGYFYYLGTSDDPNQNNGLVEVWGTSAAGNGTVRLGGLDLNGAGNGAELGFVRLGMGPDGTGWILAGDGTTLYLAKFATNALNPVTIVVEDASVTLTGGVVADFVNGDICLDGNGRLVALANNGSGVTQIFTGSPAGAATILTKKWDLVDGSNNAFTGSVNGVAFEKATSNSGLYISTSDGLYYINSTLANIPSGTIPCTIVWSGSGLQDLASNFFPNTIITPVSMSSFGVIKQGTNAMLNWTTVTEINTNYFEIERSLDGINFTTVGTKAAAGNSTDVIAYQHVDPIASLSGVLYYRIKTVDQDGKVSYSKVVSLRLTGAVKAFNVYPNPFTSDLKVVVEVAADEAATLRISNAAGQTVFSRSSMLQKGNNVLVVASELSALQKGMYFVELITENGKQTQKIIKR